MKKGDKFRVLVLPGEFPDVTEGSIYVVDEIAPLAGYVYFTDDAGDHNSISISHIQVLTDIELGLEDIKNGNVWKKVPKTMTTKEYFEFIEGINAKMLDLVKKKNADYTGGESPFANFKIAEKFGVDPIVGLSVRMGDKMQRLQSYCKNGKLEVDGEGLADIAYDFIGYSWLLLGLMRERELNGK